MLLYEKIISLGMYRRCAFEMVGTMTGFSVVGVDSEQTLSESDALHLMTLGILSQLTAFVVDLD